MHFSPIGPVFSRGEPASPPQPNEADAGPADSASAAQPGGRVWAAVLAVLLVLLLTGSAVAGVLFTRVRQSAAASASQQAAVAAARKAVTDLTTADYRHPQQYANRLRADATGKFLRLFVNSATGFRNILIQGKVETTGRAVSAGVQRAGPGSAELSVLAFVTVRNSQFPQGFQRVYRLTVSMVTAGSRWLVSSVRFVN